MPHPDVSTYRLHTYNTLKLNPGVCTAEQAFIQRNASVDLELTTRSTLAKQSDCRTPLRSLTIYILCRAIIVFTASKPLH